MRRFQLYSLILLTGVLGGCHEKASSQHGGRKLYETAEFKQYWYSGKAEVSSYTLNQSRYGEDRKGNAVLIFVTEDLSLKKQVKLDNPSSAGNDKVSVLKLNFTKNFITGIYPYSMMESVFTPVRRDQHPNALKVTMSSQEWCGQVFSQLNLEENAYHLRSFSYFEQEGSEDRRLKKVLVEDEVWNIIRLQPAALPEGELEIIPSLFFVRLMHVPLEPLKAQARKEEGSASIHYTITYDALDRKLTIEFEKTFPHKIIKWDEAFKERDGTVRHTTATLDKTLNVDYWTKNKNAFGYLRDSLHLPSDH